MAKEIGGYLELESFFGEEYYPGGVRLNNARNALLYILRARKITKLYIPYFLCDSISTMLDREHIDYGYYHISRDFLPDPAFLPKDGGTVYLVNYYGMLSDKNVLTLQQRFNSVIVDNVQAFFQQPVNDVDTVYSCRKFFGVPDGGYAMTTARLLQTLEEESVMNCMNHLIGRFESDCAGRYYQDFRSNEEFLDHAPMRAMSRITHNLLCAVDYNRVRVCRENNCLLLSELLNDSNPLQYVVPIGPFAYPFYAEHGRVVRQRLAKDGIFIPMLWPNVISIGNEWEQRMAENILPLPCDQRFGEEEMRYLATAVLRECSKN